MMTMSESHLLLCFLSVLLLCYVPVSSIFIYNDPVDGLVACLPHQIQAVTQFKNEFGSSRCNQTEFFNGVWCDNTTGEVTKLQLPSGCLSGTLNPNSSLFGLHHLRYLNLSYNDFTSSSLPSGFGNLNRLEVLSLSFNGFIGQVPSSFSNLSHLSFLGLSHNELTGSFPFVQNLTKLSILNLADNNLFGTIPSSLFTMPFLSVLDLNYNHFTAGRIEVPNSSRLKIMYLGQNQFEGHILKPISKLTTLTELDLSFLNISSPLDFSFFSSLKSLEYLDLSGNSISQASLSSYSDIPLSMGTLLLSGCNITEFPNILKPLQNLTSVDISHNRIKGKVPAWLWKFPFLNIVTVFNNSLHAFEGSAEVLVNSSVQILGLDSNCFEGALPNLPLSIVFFSARTNRFTGNIPLSTCKRNSLLGLDLSYNNFTGPIPQCLSNLVLASFRKNNLKGSLPDIFYAGSSLRILDIGYNQLTGKFPKSLVNCSSLELLSVEHNRIKDAFPIWLKALPNLKILILRSNKLYGSISPPDQGPLGFPELRIFEVAYNNFTGSLPPSYFVNWKATMNENGGIYMEYKKIDYKDFYYSIDFPIDLQYKGLFMEQEVVLTSYSAIDFSGNGFKGQIPESIGLLKGLIALNLSNNAFIGNIPLSLANLTELESLDMSRNKLSGTIPNGLKTLSFLGFINVSHNQLKGEIPQGPQITGQSKSSFEGNAGLCGLPLEESCFGTTTPPTQEPEEEDKEEEDEVLNWKGVVIGCGPGLLFGLAIAQVIASYKPEWLVKIIG